MVRPWIEISLCQYEKLNKLREKMGESLSGVIRQAVSQFVLMIGPPAPKKAILVSGFPAALCSHPPVVSGAHADAKHLARTICPDSRGFSDYEFGLLTKDPGS